MNTAGVVLGTASPPSAAPVAEPEEPAIELRAVSKAFENREPRPASLREQFIRLLSARSRPPPPPWVALRDISLSIRRGETWALLGRNGAGKSTLLRLIAGIYWPTSGEIVTRGRLGAMIELGAGFQPELSGRENVFLYGSILGLARAELAPRYEEIVAFAGIGPVMETPVKYYSSGMRMRLGFSVALAVDPAILLLDEVLAIGDADFRERCLERVAGLQRSDCTVVIATHDLDAARAFATHALWLEEGQVALHGKAGETIDAYADSFSRSLS